MPSWLIGSMNWPPTVRKSQRTIWTINARPGVRICRRCWRQTTTGRHRAALGLVACGAFGL